MLFTPDPGVSTPCKQMLLADMYSSDCADLVPLRSNSLGALSQRQTQVFKKHLWQRRPLRTIILAADWRCLDARRRGLLHSAPVIEDAGDGKPHP